MVELILEAVMKQARGKRYNNIPDHLLGIIRDEFGDDKEVFILFDEFFCYQDYNRDFARRLVDTARSGSKGSWAIRSLAILMLEHQILKRTVGDSTEYAFLFDLLGIRLEDQAFEKVLREGYTTTDMPGFTEEFRRRLARLSRIHLLIKGESTSESGLRDFIYAARRTCKLTLARYLWLPDEVVEKIFDQTRRSKGVKDMTPLDHPYMKDESEQALAGLPDFEAEIICRIRDESQVYWVGDSTSAEINSLVEYPLHTVVLVIKPPGSNIEFEIKRAGNRGGHLLDIIFEKGGIMVPPPHRLHGGSMGHMLRWEAGAGSILSRIFRLVHGDEAPVCRTISISSVYSVPTSGDEQHVLQYFTERDSFGAGFDRMRSAMRDSLEAFNEDWGAGSPMLPGELGLTAQFLTQVAPCQSIIVGTSSFRLHRLIEYLSPRGADIYFHDGLDVRYTDQQARQFVDEILDEVLGIYTPPDTEYQNHEQYVRAAFRVAENRDRADRNYISLMRQMGEFWGTLLGVRGFSDGESFVVRNVGLRSVWVKGNWEVRLIFMDNDLLNIIGKRYKNFHPMEALFGMRKDFTHIFGGKIGDNTLRGSTGALEKIYQPDKKLIKKGNRAIRKAMVKAYRITRAALHEKEELRGLFYRPFLDRIDDWDDCVAGFLRAAGDEARVGIWRENLERILENKGYEKALIREHVKGIEKFSSLLESLSFLYL